MRAPVDTIVAPLFPSNRPWVNIAGAQVSTLQRGKPMLVEFWDFCRPNSIRTLPYMKAWHERYAEHGLRVIGVHCPGFDASHEEQAVREAVQRLGIDYPVLIDSDLELWEEYGNRGWPARYLFDGHARLFDYHFGEGAYTETELAIQGLLGMELEPLPPVRAEDAPDAPLAPQSEDRDGLWSGPYAAGSVWAVLDGSGTVEINGGDAHGGRTLNVKHPGAYLLVEHERHTAGELDVELGDGVSCLATCFTPGVASG